MSAGAERGEGGANLEGLKVLVETLLVEAYATCQCSECVHDDLVVVQYRPRRLRKPHSQVDLETWPNWTVAQSGSGSLANLVDQPRLGLDSVKHSQHVISYP